MKGAVADWLAGGRSALPGRVWIVLAVAISVVVADAVASMAADLPIRVVGWDARVYWDALNTSDPYGRSQLGVLGSYLYSPAFLLLMAPLVVLGWHGYLFILTAILTACAVWLLEAAGPRVRTWSMPLAALAIADVWAGNVHLPMTVAIVIGLRSGPAWAGVALTKVTPAIGLLWHVVRRDLRPVLTFGTAMGVVLGLSLLAGVDAWAAWIAMLTAQDRPVGLAILPLPLPIRLIGAAAVVTWGAVTSRRWSVPLACLLALPAVWPTSLTMLLGVAALANPAVSQARRTRLRLAPVIGGR